MSDRRGPNRGGNRRPPGAPGYDRPRKETASSMTNTSGQRGRGLGRHRSTENLASGNRGNGRGGFQSHHNRGRGRGGHNNYESGRDKDRFAGYGKGRGEGGRNDYTPRPLGFGRLKSWTEIKDAGELVLFMTTERQQIQALLNGDRIKEDFFTLLLKALDYAFTAQHQRESIRHLLDVICTSRFFEHFTTYLMEKQISGCLWTDAEMFLKSTMHIVEEILDKLPQFGIKCLTVTNALLNAVPSVESVQENQELKDTLTSLSQRAKEIYKFEKEKESKPKRGLLFENSESDVPPDDFQNLPVVPVESDLQEDAKPFVRCAITDGAYQDVLHYLDVQFRLMRQDFILPLRKGITEYKQNGCQKNFTCSDLRLYYNVHITEIIHNDGIEHLLQFDVSNLKNVRWEFSKRLIFGSLVCLSKDNFDTVLFATVTGRERDGLAKGYVNVNFKSGLDEVFNSTSYDVYVMAETTAYFESYSHVLEGLQEMAMKLPLQDYIVRCKRTLKPPKYLLPSGGIASLPVYDLRCMMKHRVQNEVPVLTTVKWPEADLMCLNRSQREAAQLALTKEMAIIQGPPGTGKTYVGLKVMQALIENKEAMAGNDENSTDPILVVCYTNHALDQFLEGVFEFCNYGIVRVGGKHDSPLLENFSMKAWKQKMRRERVLNSTSVRRSKAECLRELEAVSTEIEKLNKTVESLETDIKSEDVLGNHISHIHKDSLLTDGPDQRHGRSHMRSWLNASSSSPQSAIPKMIERHLTNLVLRWDEPSPDIIPTQNMNIIQRARIYCHCLIQLRGGLQDEYAYLHAMSGLSQEVLQRMQEIQYLLECSGTRILGDEELGQLLPPNYFHDILKLIKQRDRHTEVTVGSAFKVWLLGLHRGLHEQLDDIEVLTNALKGEEDDFENFDDREATSQAQSDRVFDDDDDDINEMDYSKKTQAARNSFVSVMQRTNMLGIKEDILDDIQDEAGGWQTVKHSKPLSFKKIQTKLRTVAPCTDEKESQIDNVWKLELNQRFALYKLWIKRFKEKLSQNMQTLVKNYTSAYERKKEANREEELHILRNAKVIGMTTTGAAKHRAVLQAVGCRIVVVEEAAEVLESHIVTALNKNCLHLILIGDHQQLRPSATVYELAKDYGLEISLFERLIKNSVPHVVLEEQHRMRPEIARLMRHIYPALQDHETVFRYENIKGVAKNIFFINHKERESHVDDTRSKANTHEAKYLVALCKYLLCQGYEPTQITILAAYAGQVLAIKKTMKEQKFEQHVRVTAVDNFQGEENDIILLSLVRSNSENNVGFLKVDNRVCVALSRAKKGLYTIGNIDSLASQSKLWSNILKTAKMDEIIGEGLPVVCQNHTDFKLVMVSDEDFKKCPDGGCGCPCEYGLDCGHVCARKCHGYDQDHVQYKCQKKCPKKCKDGHPCVKKCSQDCGDCRVSVMKTIPACGHEEPVPCYLAAEKAVCSQKCPALLDCEHPCPGKCGQCRKDKKHQRCQQNAQYSWPCGHICSVPCYMKPSLYPCQSKCGTLLKCGHSCVGKCSECLNGAVHVACGKKCDKILPCGHTCSSFCGIPCLPCTKDCPGQCRHTACRKCKSPPQCGHSCISCIESCFYKCDHAECKKLCHEICDKEPCNKRCRKKLKCGHRCSGVCGELCICEKCAKVLEIKEERTADVTPDALAGKDDVSVDSEVQENAANDSGGKADSHSDQSGDDQKRLLLKIPTCSHIFFVDELDKYVSSFDPGGSSFIECPVCQKPILNCHRYEKINKERSKKREVAKIRLRKEAETPRNKVTKLQVSLAQLEDSSLLKRFHELKVENMKMNKVEMKAKSFQLKCAFVLSEIHSQETSDSNSSASERVFVLRDAVLKIGDRLTEQQKTEFTTEFLRCFWLTHLGNLERMGNMHDIVLPSHLTEDLLKTKKTLEQINPDIDELHRVQHVAEILRRRIEEMAEKAIVRAKCLLHEQSSARVIKILASKDDEMLCDLMEKKERVSAVEKTKASAAESLRLKYSQHSELGRLGFGTASTKRTAREHPLSSRLSRTRNEFKTAAEHLAKMAFTDSSVQDDFVHVNDDTSSDSDSQ